MEVQRDEKGTSEEGRNEKGRDGDQIKSDVIR